MGNVCSKIGWAILGRNSDYAIWRAACEACTVTCNLGTNSVFVPRPR
jgi:hypothetical protein